MAKPVSNLETFLICVDRALETTMYCGALFLASEVVSYMTSAPGAPERLACLAPEEPMCEVDYLTENHGVCYLDSNCTNNSPLAQLSECAYDLAGTATAVFLNLQGRNAQDAGPEDVQSAGVLFRSLAGVQNLTAALANWVTS